MKRTSTILMFTALAATGMMLGGCESNQQQQNQARHTAMKQDVKLPTGNYFQQDQQHSQFVQSQQRGLKQVAQQMNNNYKQIGTTTYSRNANAITLSLHGQKTENTLKLAKQGNAQAKKFWKELTQGFNKTVDNVATQTKDPQLKMNIINNGQGDPLYSVQKHHIVVNKLK